MWTGVNNKGVDTSTTVSDVGASATTICTIKIEKGASRLWASIYNSDFNVSDFVVQVNPASDAVVAGTVFTTANSTAEFTTSIVQPVLGVESDLMTLSSDTSGAIWMDVGAMYAVRFKALARNGKTSKVKVHWQVR